MRIDTTDLKAFKTKLENFKSNTEERNNRYLELYEAEQIITEAKQNTPVDTGALKNAFDAAPAQDSEITVYNGQEYASFVEFGARGRIGVYMLRNAVNNANMRREQKYNAFLKKEFENS